MASIEENLRATLLSLKQISDRVKSLILTVVTKSELNSAKQEVLDAIDDIPEPDLSTIAKESTSQEILTGTAKQGTNPNATNTAILAAVEQSGVPQVVVPDTTTSQELAPNTLYVFPNRTSDLVLTLGAPIADIVNEYHFFVEIGASLPTITFPQSVQWVISAPAFVANSKTEISILNNSGVWVLS